MSDKIDFIKQLTDIDPELKLTFRRSGEFIEVEDVDELLKSRFPDASTRFGNNNYIELAIRLGKVNILLSIELLEFYPCCGKSIGRRLAVKNYALRDGATVYFTENMNLLMSIFMNIIEYLLRHCKYSSLSFIVSKAEQLEFYNLITKLSTYKQVNEFKNERMSTKNLCVEFCKNLW